MLSALSPVPESASPGHFYTSAFGHQEHLSASSEPGNGWRTLGTSTCPKSRVSVLALSISLKRTAAGSNPERANTPGGEAGSTDSDRLQDTTSSQLLHCPLFIKPRQEQKVAVGPGLCYLGVLVVCTSRRELAQWRAGWMWWGVDKVLLKLRGNRGTAWLEIWAHWHFLLASTRATGAFVCLGFEKNSKQVHTWKKKR